MSGVTSSFFSSGISFWIIGKRNCTLIVAIPEKPNRIQTSRRFQITMISFCISVKAIAAAVSPMMAMDLGPFANISRTAFRSVFPIEL